MDRSTRRPPSLCGPLLAHPFDIAREVRAMSGHHSREAAAAAAQPVTITIGGDPVAKGRPRLSRKGFAYTPAATRKYEAHGRLAAQLAMGNRPPIAVPVRIVALVELPLPASWSKSRTAAALAGAIRPTSRPDLDNYVKAGLDAINTIVVVDDSYVVEMDVRKQYGTQPKLTLSIIPLSAEPSKTAKRGCSS
jgi:Holliday junction resolvase RusA-like endonuclease